MFNVINQETYDKLSKGSVVLVQYGLCVLMAPGTSGRFVMHGPSGCHSLDASVTDRARLNAHWTGFISN